MKRILLLAAITVALSSASPVLAQDASNSGTATSSTQTTQNLRERIERIVDEKREQIRGALTEINQRKRAVIGEVTRVTAEAITISNKDGTEIIPIDEAISIERDNDTLNLEDVAVGNWILAMGILEKDTFSPITLSVSTQTLRPRPRKVILGTITEIARNTITVTPRGRDETIEFDLQSNTRYENLEAEEIDEDNLEEEMQALVVGFEEEANNGSKSNEAVVVRILTTITGEE